MAPPRRPAPPTAIAAVSLCALVVGCAPLDAWPTGCGNSVVDPGEDCDGEFSSAGHCGAVGSRSACRWDCSSGAACPAGFGCAQDGICRRSSGELETGPTLEGAATALSVVDADADGRPDLVRSSPEELALSFFTGRVESSHPAVRVSEAPYVVADLTGDGPAEVVTRSPYGVSVYRVTPQRGLSAQLYSTTPLPQGARAVTLDGLPPPFFDELVYLTDAGVATGPGPDAERIADGAFGAGDVEAVTGELLEDAIARCDEIALARASTSQIVVVTACRQDAGTTMWNVIGPGHLVLPSIQTIDPIESYSEAGHFGRLVSLADVDGDGHLDVVVGTMFGAEIAYGVGDGTFHSTADTPASDGDGKTSKLTMFVGDSFYQPDAPLAVGDVNGDGFADFVEWAPGVVVSQLVGAEIHYVSAPPSDLARAWLTDLDGDGRVDILATRASYSGGVQPGYPGSIGDEKPVLYRGAGDGAFTEVPIPVDGLVSAMTVGDFDGDGATDLALALMPDDASVPTQPQSGGPTTTDLAIAWGRAAAPPSPPQVIGRFPDVVELVAGRLVGGDAPDDLVVISGAGEPTEAILAGASDRQLRSPFEFHDPATGELELPSSGPIAGRFDAGGALSVVSAADGSVSLGGSPGLWSLSFDADAQIAARRSVEPASVYGGPGVAIDLDGEGVDELVEVSYTVLQVLRLSGSEVVLVAEGIWPDGESASGAPAAADLDGDGRPDLLVPLSSARLAIVWNDGTGSVDLSKAVYVGEGAEQVGPPKGAGGDFAQSGAEGDGAGVVDAVVAFGAVELDGDPALELAVTTLARVEILDLDVTTRTYRSTNRLVPAPTSSVAFAAGDLDGDGVPDLAVGGPDGATILWGVPVQP